MPNLKSTPIAPATVTINLAKTPPIFFNSLAYSSLVDIPPIINPICTANSVVNPAKTGATFPPTNSLRFPQDVCISAIEPEVVLAKAPIEPLTFPITISNISKFVLPSTVFIPNCLNPLA